MRVLSRAQRQIYHVIFQYQVFVPYGICGNQIIDLVLDARLVFESVLRPWRFMRYGPSGNTMWIIFGLDLGDLTQSEGFTVHVGTKNNVYCDLYTFALIYLLILIIIGLASPQVTFLLQPPTTTLSKTMSALCGCYFCLKNPFKIPEGSKCTSSPVKAPL